MASKEIFITDYDLKRLMMLIRTGFDRTNEPYIKELERELNRAHVVNPKDIPGDVITMNSKVSFRFLDSDDEMTYQLVFPEDANIDEGRISILAPIGTALLGYKVGDVIEWKVPAGVTRVQVMKILYQPEAAGDYHL